MTLYTAFVLKGCFAQGNEINLGTAIFSAWDAIFLA